MTYFEDRNILITGGAGGIGLLMAEYMAKLGGNIIIWDNNDNNISLARQRFENAGITATFFNCDLSDKNDIKENAEATLAKHRYIDILINNAGFVTGKPFSDCSENEIELTFKVNTLAHFYTVKAFLPGMLKEGFGHIVTISSAAGLVGVTGLADYSASKFAVVGFDESLRSEFKKNKTKIKTTLVCPYFINTGMFDGVKTRFPLLLPILKPEKVAHKIVRAIAKQKPRLIMPPMVYSTFLLRILPVKIFDFVADIFGIQDSMSEFKGRK